MKENVLCLFLQLLEIPSAQSPSPEVWQHSHGMSPVGIEMRITTKVGGKRKHARRGAAECPKFGLRERWTVEASDADDILLEISPQLSDQHLRESGSINLMHL